MNHRRITRTTHPVEREKTLDNVYRFLNAAEEAAQMYASRQPPGLAALGGAVKLLADLVDREGSRDRRDGNEHEGGHGREAFAPDTDVSAYTPYGRQMIAEMNAMEAFEAGRQSQRRPVRTLQLLLTPPQVAQLHAGLAIPLDLAAMTEILPLENGSILVVQGDHREVITPEGRSKVVTP